MAVTVPHGRMFAVTLGIASYLALRLMRRVLIHFRDAAIVRQPESKSQYITQKVEDSLKLSTLNRLLDSPNYSIQDTTAIIICERALHDTTAFDTLLHLAAQPDYDTRNMSIRALTILLNSSTVKKGMTNTPKLYMAIVKSLEYSLTDYEHNQQTKDWDNWALRDVSEQGCLMILSQMTYKHGIEGVVKAQFVDRWLVKEPWGETDSERQQNFVSMLSKQHFRLCTICEPLFQDRAGRRQLERAKLVPVMDNIMDDTRMINGESTAGEDLFVGSVRPRREQTTAEEHLRRRHREAMVLNDGITPLGRDDIIERER